MLNDLAMYYIIYRLNLDDLNKFQKIQWNIVLQRYFKYSYGLDFNIPLHKASS